MQPHLRPPQQSPRTSAPSCQAARPCNCLSLPPLPQQTIEAEQLAKLREYIEGLGGRLDGGWKCRANIRDFGSRAGSMDTWFTAPHGETFRSKVAVRFFGSWGGCGCRLGWGGRLVKAAVAAGV